MRYAKYVMTWGDVPSNRWDEHEAHVKVFEDKDKAWVFFLELFDDYRKLRKEQANNPFVANTHTDDLGEYPDECFQDGNGWAYFADTIGKEIRVYKIA